jgi:hypothetical protein
VKKHSNNINKTLRFEEILDDLDNSQYEFNELVIQPTAGYVIETSRERNNQKICINVCHSNMVGAISALNDQSEKRKIDDNSSSLTNFPYIIGAINCYQSAPTSEAVHNSTMKIFRNPAITIDVVIPSRLMIHLLQDENHKEQVIFYSMKNYFLILISGFHFNITCSCIKKYSA